jgi:ubiquinone/menaquinone biosynthesis C-methylase UbiE
VDLLFDRLLHAHQILPNMSFVNADGQAMPFLPASFDLVLHYTAISSVLDKDVRRNICAEMFRVLKPNGMILSYDFWLNPTNHQTNGIRPVQRFASFSRIAFMNFTRSLLRLRSHAASFRFPGCWPCSSKVSRYSTLTTW